MKTLDFGGSMEVVYERSDYPPAKIASIFKNDVMAVIGYGTQGMAQSMNMRDNKLKVIIGVRKGGASWNDAMKDGWVPGKTLFSIEEACSKGTIIMNLLSDAGQKGMTFFLYSHVRCMANDETIFNQRKNSLLFPWFWCSFPRPNWNYSSKGC